ncbi:hypothetical protein Salat_2418100 [Sesamum alatum]|uniref:Uncharacterized protein n=1 Tax=Sesamum alatum TaxID=300844 RepID=A0AAE1XY32_9LAMI|nr:hypothetical protein Salat_2418100 [Sesamum alatum]
MEPLEMNDCIQVGSTPQSGQVCPAHDPLPMVSEPLFCPLVLADTCPEEELHEGQHVATAARHLANTFVYDGNTMFSPPKLHKSTAMTDLFLPPLNSVDSTQGITGALRQKVGYPSF